MDFVKFVMSKPGSRAWSGPFSASKTPSIEIPYGSGFDTTMKVPVPQSGMERAEWMDVHGAKGTKYPAAPSMCSAGSGGPSIGSLEREILGSTRDEYLGGMIVRSHNWFDLNDPATEISENAGRAWNAQVSASNGLWDENNEVYTTQDSETIWA